MAANQRRLTAIGNYQLSSITIGKGSFGKVVVANHVVLKKQVAMKILTFQTIGNSYVKKNIAREVAIMSKLRHHPNVVILHEIYATKDFFCLIMDFYPGGNLCDLVQDHPLGKLEEKRARLYFKQIVDGLNYIHHQNIIHRDLKLDNIFLDKEKTRVAIGDFGLSNFLKPGAGLETRCGSAEYAAPEIFDKKKNYDQAVDIWSIGIILYAMLSGEFPFDVESGDYSKILVGLTMDNFAILDNVSLEAKLLISQLLVVDSNYRIKIHDVLTHMWIKGTDEIDPEPTLNPVLTLEMQVEVAKMVQAKLKLSHTTPQEILAYIYSAKGMFGKTAGCFNLIARDLYSSSTQPIMIANIRNPVLVTTSPKSSNPSINKSSAPITSNRPPGEEEQTRSFWNSIDGRKALVDLQNIKHDKHEKEMLRDDAEGAANEEKTHIFESSKPTIKSWRRSIYQTGEKRVGRLKRVDRVTNNEEQIGKK